ncbi:MAG: hypothetical protein ACJ8R9_06030 [Steroidobacteraceae bacterium]
MYDRIGGRNSAPGIKSFVNHKIRDLEVLEEQFVSEKRSYKQLISKSDARYNEHLKKLKVK